MKFNLDCPLNVCGAALAAVAIGLLTLPARPIRADEPPAQPSADDAPAEPAVPVTAERIGQLIQDLGNDDFFVRERAQDELIKIGFEAFDALSAAEEHDDIEIAARARYLVRLMRIDWVVAGDPPVVKELLANYETIDDNGRQDLIQKLADLPDAKGLSVLCRMVRFEKSSVLSKLAALALLSQKPPADADWPAREAAILSGIGQSPRPGADWLRAYVAARNEPSEAVETWTQLIAGEEQVADESPHQTRPEIVIALWRQQIDLLKKLNRHEDALAAMTKMVDRETGETESLIKLVDWLAEQQAWSVVDTVSQKFNETFEQQPRLLYVLAQARQTQGDEAAAEEAAGRALRLNEGKHEQYYVTVFFLQRRGLLKWAEKEFRQTIDVGPQGDRYVLNAQFRLAELLHDQGDEGGAADVLQPAILAMEANIKEGNAENNIGRELSAMRARLGFFQACEMEAKGQRAAQIERLQEALDHDPLDADVLIALFRAPDLEPALRDRTRQLIRDAVETFRRQSQDEPDDPTPYNQLAWLVSNTEGDQGEALRCSQKSLELRPDTAGYLDTLGRCYFAQGDLENAIKHQSRAIELDPHSGLMNKQLALFKAELAKRNQPGSQ